MSTESSYENLAAIATVDNQSKSDIPEVNLDAMVTVDNQSKSDVPQVNLDAMVTEDNQSKSDVPQENLDAMATVDNQSKSDVPQENLDAMATEDNQSKSDIPEVNLDAMVTVDNQSKSDVPQENLDPMATLDNQSKSDVPQENLDAMATEDNQSKSDVPQENLDAMATEDNQSKSDVPQENLDAMATEDNQSKSDVLQENLDPMATVDNQSKSDVPQENLDAMATEDNQSKSDVPQENLDAMATVDNQSKSDVSQENLDAMATEDNQSKSDVPQENLDEMATEDNQSKSDVSQENLDAMATVDNQSKSDVPQENLVAMATEDNQSKSDVPQENLDVMATVDNQSKSDVPQENLDEDKEVDHIHLGHDLVNKVVLVNSEPKLQILRKNDAEIATGIQFENIGHIGDCVAMVTIKTEPISDDLDNISTEYEVVKHNFLLGLPQSSHNQIGLNNEDSKHLEHQSGSNFEDPKGGSLMAYRVDSDGESDAESSCNSTSDTSSLESNDEEESNELNTETKINRLLDMDEDLDEKKLKKNKFGLEDIRTRGELCLDELPPIEDLHITVDEKVKLVPVGQVSSVIGCLVVVQSNMQIAPLNEDTVLFLEDRTAIGQVFEVFGPVVLPWYSFRFNSPADVENKGIKVGTPIFCAPEEENFTKYVFVNALRQLKGSDASWENNNEPPEWVREFSDDEEEKRAKQKKKNKNRNTKEGTEDTTQNTETKKKRNRQREKTQGVITVKADPDSTEFSRCQEWPPRDGGPKQGYRYSESQINPFHNVQEQHHQDRNQQVHFAQRNRSNQWRPQTSDIRSPGFQFGGSPSFSSRFNQPFVAHNSNNCPAEFQMRGQLNEFSNIREPHSGGQMHRIGNNLGSPQAERNHSPRMGMLGQDQPPKMGNFRPNLSHMELRLTPQSEIQPQRNHFSQNQQGPLFMGHNQLTAPIGQPPFGCNRFQTEMQGHELNNNRQGTYQSYPVSNAGLHFIGPSTDRPMLGRDKGPHFTGPSPDRSMLGRDMGRQFTGLSPDRPMLGSDTGPQLMGSSQDRAMLGRDEGPQFTGQFSDRLMQSKDRNAYQQPFSNYGQFSNSFCASSNVNNQMNHSVEQMSNRGQNYQTGNADSHGFGGPHRGHYFNQSPQGNLVDSRLIYNKNTF